MAQDPPPLPDTRLSPESARAVDAFLAGRDAASDHDATQRRLARIGRVFDLLDRDPAASGGAEVDEALVRSTLRRARSAKLARDASVVALSPDDADALDALLEGRALGNATGPRPAGSAERTATLNALLSLLDADADADADADSNDTVEAATADELTSRTMQRCREGRQRQRFNQQVAMVSQGPAFVRSTPWRQVMAAAGVVLLALSLLLPALQHNRDFADRVACADNLAAAGRAFGQYAADFGGLLPRAPMAAGGKWWNVGQDAGDGRVNSNSAHLYILVRRGYLDAEDLACPTNEHADDVPLTRGHRDWASPEQVSFSFQNVSGRTFRLVRTPDLALLADKNPLFVAKAGRVTFDRDADPNSPSRAHGGEGQNTLLADGIVVWTIRPTIRKHDLFADDPRGAGDEADNIWVAAGIDDYDGDEAPATERDSFLVP